MWTSDPSIINVATTTEPLPAFEPEDLITLEQLMALTQLSKWTIYREIKDGRFPAPIKIATGGNRWLRSEIVDHLMQRVLERNQRQQALAQKESPAQ